MLNKYMWLNMYILNIFYIHYIYIMNMYFLNLFLNLNTASELGSDFIVFIWTLLWIM